MSELSPDALKTALERGRVTDGSRLASQLEENPESIRTLARLALASLPAGPAEGEDEAAWATLSEADPLDMALPQAPAPPAAAFAGPEVVAPMAPMMVRPPRSYGWVWGVLAGLCVAAGAAGTWWVMQSDPDQPTVAAAPTSAGPASLASAAPATQAAPASLAAAASEAPASEAPASAAPTSAAPASLAVRPRRVGRAVPGDERGNDEPAERRAPASAPPVAPATAAARKPAGGGGDEVDALLGSLDGNRPARPGARPADGELDAVNPNDPLLPERLTRPQILNVVKQAAGKVRGCKAQSPDATGTVMVAMVIEPKGVVSSASVAGGPLKGTPAGSCIEDQVKTFKFPQFRGEPMRLNMPFAL